MVIWLFVSTSLSDRILIVEEDSLIRTELFLLGDLINIHGALLVLTGGLARSRRVGAAPVDLRVLRDSVLGATSVSDR